MYLDDVEIHWIHEQNLNILQEKYKRRLLRLQGLINSNCANIMFLFGYSELCNNHSREDYKNMIKGIYKFTKFCLYYKIS